MPPRIAELGCAFGVLFLGGSLGCEAPRRDPSLDTATVNAGLDPANHRIVSLVAHFETHGVKLVHERGGWWRVTEPASPDYDVIVSLRAFPESATADQMQNALMQINLAYLLNAPAHAAMSYPSLRGAGPGTAQEPRFVTLKATLERLFREYPAPAAGTDRLPQRGNFSRRTLFPGHSSKSPESESFRTFGVPHRLVYVSGTGCQVNATLRGTRKG